MTESRRPQTNAIEHQSTDAGISAEIQLKLIIGTDIQEKTKQLQ